MNPQIVDAELRDLFRAESAEHVQAIESGLLELQKGASNRLLLEDIFRAAHSLKGAARMLGLRDIQAHAHEIENFLSELLKPSCTIDESGVQAQLSRLDKITHLVECAVSTSKETASHEISTCPSAHKSSTSIEPHIVGATSVEVDVATIPGEVSASNSVQEPSRDPSSPESITSVITTPGIHSDFRFSTIRVDARKLDTLMQHCGELVVGISRMNRYRIQLEELITSLEMRKVGEKNRDSINQNAVEELKGLLREYGHDVEKFSSETLETEHCIQDLRLLPMTSLLEMFPRMVHDLGIELGKQVTFRTSGESTVADKHVIEELKAPIMHLLRNAIDHGIESPEERRQANKIMCGTVSVSVDQAMGFLAVSVADDGRGLDLVRIREQAMKQKFKTTDELSQMNDQQLQSLIFRSGFSTAPMITDISGRGVGLDVVRAVVERLHGNIEVASTAGCGTCITLRIPLAMSSTRAVVLREWGQGYAIPFSDIASIKRLRAHEIHLLEGQNCIYLDDQPIPLERLGLLLDRSPAELKQDEVIHCVILNVNSETFAICFDEIVGSEDIVVRPLPMPLARVRNVAGTAVLGTGDVCPVLNSYDLMRSMSRTEQIVLADSLENESPEIKRILLADDSITTRMLERRILESAGYEVVIAVDGQDAMIKLSQQSFDAVVSDVEMPRMSGLELVEQLRKSRTYSGLPVVLVTTLSSEEDRRRGMEAGADAYISKPEFNQSILLDCLARLV